jgi:type IV secretory pathway TraG/TraD family ATPase VirD4
VQNFLEDLLLSTLSWFFTWNGGLILVWLGAIAGIGYQFLRGKGNMTPALIGFGFLLAALYHMSKGESFARSVEEYLKRRDSSDFYRPAAPLGEKLFSSFLGDPSERSFVSEIFLVFFVCYIFIALLESFRARKGQTIGSQSALSSLWSLFARKQQIRPARSYTNELGSGDLATTEQILKWCKPSGKPGDTVLKVTDLRGSEGIALKNGAVVWPRDMRNRHILIIAKTGSGKTTKMILPVLYSDCICKTRSTIVIDSKPEMWKKLAGLTAKYNPEKEILLFNPLDRIRSLSWNILSKISDDTDAKLIANTIVMATDVPGAKSDSPFFRNNALAILNAIMVGLLHDPNDVLSMPRIHELVQSGIKPLCSWLEQHPQAYRTTRTFTELAKSGSQNADTIMSELSMRLAAWDLTAIRATTSENELDLEKLIEKPTLLIVEFRESELEMLRPMANVIVVEILRFLTKRAEQMEGVTLPRPVSLVIDEFASALGRLPDIHVKLNTIRSRNVSICAAIQSTAQVKANYGDDADSVLAGFSTKIFMPALDLVDSEWASKESGQMTIRFKTASIGSNKKIIEFFASRNDSVQEQVQQRAVLTPDEIGRPVDNISTFFLPSTPVFQGFLVPYYEDSEIGSRINEAEHSETEYQLRNEPISFKEKLPDPPTTDQSSGMFMPLGISNTKGWSDEQLRSRLEAIKKDYLEWPKTSGSAKKWWESFESENQNRLALVFRLAEELKNRKATITEFFLSYVYSNTDNIQANLHYLDYTRIKKEEERKRKEAAQQAATEKNNSDKDNKTSTSEAKPSSSTPSQKENKENSVNTNTNTKTNKSGNQVAAA